MNRFGRLLRVALLGTALTALTTVIASATVLGAGTVTVDALRMRATPALDSAILATAQKGDTIIACEMTHDGWYKVIYDTHEGYISSAYLDILDVATMELGYGKITTEGDNLSLRASSNGESDVLIRIPNGAVLTLDGVAHGWYLVSYGNHTGYISSDYVTIVDTLPTSSLDQDLIAFAKEQLGKPYVYGSAGPNSFDCSGFTSYVYKQFGYTLSRSSVQQQYDGYAVSKGELQPGDLLIFSSYSRPVGHAGIYIGNGTFIHAASGTGAVIISNLSESYYTTHYVGARRIF